MRGKITQSHIIPALNNSLRLSDIDTSSFIIYCSKSSWKKAIKKELVLLNGKTACTADWVKGGERIDILEDETEEKVPVLELDLDVVYQDDYLAILNKPAGIEVSGNKMWTLKNALPHNLKRSTKADALKRPEPVHRLDYPTSGVIMAAKTAEALLSLNRMFANKTIAKTYHAICIGEMPEEGVITDAVKGKKAITFFKKLDRVDSKHFEELSLLELKPETGRKHQLRKHLSGIGKPILGDLIYGIEGKILKGKGLFLHASVLEFEHPCSRETIRVKADLPGKFNRFFSDSCIS